MLLACARQASSGHAAHQPSKWELSNQQLGGSLVFADLAKRHSPRPARIRAALRYGAKALSVQGWRTGSDEACVVWRRPQRQLPIEGLRVARREGVTASARQCAQNWRRRRRNIPDPRRFEVRRGPAAAAGAPAAAPLRCCGPPTRCVWRGIVLRQLKGRGRFSFSRGLGQQAEKTNFRGESINPAQSPSSSFPARPSVMARSAAPVAVPGRCSTRSEALKPAAAIDRTRLVC